ncbi:MAG: hypothetical protein M1829_002994 [Trizodia sp. TS-e1964]|nr:MAG: hypothetical protein M1829_002994 [Trizodia sp. TS-e1964]
MDASMLPEVSSNDLPRVASAGSLNLEDRLRGMILSNVEKQTAIDTSLSRAPPQATWKDGKAGCDNSSFSLTKSVRQNNGGRLSADDQIPKVSDGSRPERIDRGKNQPAVKGPQNQNNQPQLTRKLIPDNVHASQKGVSIAQDGPIRQLNGLQNPLGISSPPGIPLPQLQQPITAASIPEARNGPLWPKHNYSAKATQQPQPRFETSHDSHLVRGQPPNEGQGITWEEIRDQSLILETIALHELPNVEISQEEAMKKDAFRSKLEEICKSVIFEHEMKQRKEGSFDCNSVELKCFGSLSSGFATKSSDMDLALLSPHSLPPASSIESAIPRLLEGRFLELNYGARLIKNTRVPIIKLCEEPTEELLKAMKTERKKWEDEGDEPKISARPSDLFENTKEIANNPHSERANGPKGSAEPETSCDETTIEGRLKNFHQGPIESLAGYFHRAKMILAEFNGRDIVPYQKFDDFSLTEKKLLRTLSEAFVDGMRHDKLKERLRSLKLPPNRAAQKSSQLTRSLYTTWLQAEGELIALIEDDLRAHGAAPNKNSIKAKAMEDWAKLLEDPSRDCVTYSRKLQRCLENIRTLPSAKLQYLSYRECDNEVHYFNRIIGILQELGGNDRSLKDNTPLTAPQNSLLRYLVGKYVDGIQNRQDRQLLREFVSSRATSPSLFDILQQHLAENQIKLFPKTELAPVQEYARLIRLYGASSDRPDVTRAQQSFSQIPKPERRPRDRYGDRLEIPKTGVGIQCDINFSNSLALHNTLLLRCYALCDQRVRPMVIFVKAWASCRKINSPYRGTLSSYGYVLMVLHYLVNIASPPVLPNLQHWTSPLSPFKKNKEIYCEGQNVTFCRNEEEIKELAIRGSLSQNTEPLGFLLRGFFEYYSYPGLNAVTKGFSWATEVLSLRTAAGGTLKKQEKGWTGAKSTYLEPLEAGQEAKEIRHRYLLAIEDPFETDHNIARTVNHDGIVAIRDEFRRAWKFILASTRGPVPYGLFEASSGVLGARN